MTTGKGVPTQKMFTALLITFLLITLLTHARARAAQVTLTWDPNPDTTVTGSFLYYGPVFSLQPLAFSLTNRPLDFSFTNRIDCGPTNTVTVTGLGPKATYYFSLTSYNEAGLESDFSPVVKYTTPPNVIVTIVLDTSTNLLNWQTLTQRWTITLPANAIQYFRPRASIIQTN